MKHRRHQGRKLNTWTVPLTHASLALMVGMLLPRLETHFFPDLVSTMSAAAAMSICSAIASGMIALTGIVFSLAFVMVQFSAIAYSPRLVIWVARDRVMSHALGVFSATFLYSLTLLAWVDRGDSGKVPLISGWLALGLLIASMGMFIALIERIGLLQVNRMLIFTGNQGRKAIQELYPPLEAVAPTDSELSCRTLPIIQTLTHVGGPQAIQAIDTLTLLELASRYDAVIELQAAVGDTMVETTPILHVRGSHPVPDESALRHAIELGDERTFEQDPKYAIRLVVDIAIKALSAAINDPTTAVQALDQIEDLLLRLGQRRLNIQTLRDTKGVGRLIVPAPTWEDFLRLALDEIRAYGAESVQVMRRMKALIWNLLNTLPPDRHPALLHWEARLKGSVARSFEDVEERRDASVPDRQGLGIGQETPAAPNTTGATH
jgi:uncharacterized membrane protein